MMTAKIKPSKPVVIAVIKNGVICHYPFPVQEPRP